MPLSDTQLKTLVRSKTTNSLSELPDDQILYFAGRGATDTSYTANIGLDGVTGSLDVAGLIADCWLYLARDDRYDSESQGAVSVSSPQARWWAQFWYAQSLRLDMGAGGMMQGTIKRADLMAPAYPNNEHGLDWWGGTWNGWRVV